MGLTVYAENMGLFHKASNGVGTAPVDVCLTPPPPPAGPIPVPYVNVCKAADLSKGSKTVKVDGQPTALSDKSYTSTSYGDEAGTQGGNVINHKTKGKAYFKMWSRTVKVEGKGVGRHGDMMGQNSTSNPVCFSPLAYVKMLAALGSKVFKPCGDKKYERPKNAADIGDGRTQKIRNASKCHTCGRSRAELKVMADRYNAERVASGRKKLDGLDGFWRDHVPPLRDAFARGGCHWTKEEFSDWAKKKSVIKPQCFRCSWGQGGRIGKKYSK